MNNLDQLQVSVKTLVKELVENRQKPDSELTLREQLIVHMAVNTMLEIDNERLRKAVENV